MTEIDDTIVQKLAAGFSGTLLRDGDEGYDEARTVYNAMFAARRPGLIARCQNTADVAAAVRIAAEHDLLVAVRGGGHSIAGFSVCDGGLMIDLSQMTAIHVDPERRTARAQPGVRLRELDAATQAFGLATPLGFISQTGIAGLTLNGGIGMLSRKHGLSCDNLIGAEIVVASGEILHVSESENAELLWGLRGGGGNFGIVTNFEYRLHEISEIYVEMKILPLEQFGPALRQLDAVADGLPDEVVGFVAAFTVPANEMFPPELHGRLSTMFIAGYLGDEASGAPAVAALSAGLEPDVAMAMTMPYVAAQQMQDEDVPDGRQNYWKSGNVDVFSDAFLETMQSRVATITSPHTSVGCMTLGGAIARVGEDETAYSGRKARFTVQIDNIWEDETENDTQIAWARSFFAAVQPHLSDGAYLNFNAEVAPADVESAYGPNYRRLQQLKDRYDPTNLFHMNQNIRPSSVLG